MGNYNPHIPDILGNEWAPVRESHVIPDLYTEHGYTFQISHSATVVSGGIFLETPVAGFSNQVHMINVYRAGQENETGPVRSIVIPVNNGSVTAGSATLTQAGTVTAAVATLDSVSYIWFEDPGGAEVDVYFDVINYSDELNGKRILAVNLLYYADSITVPPDNVSTFFSLNLVAPTAASGEQTHAITTALTVVPSSGNISEVSRISLGAICPFPVNSDREQRRYPWTYQDLLRFDSAASGRIAVQFEGVGQNSSGGSTVQLDYAALEVIYCEENRVAFGGRTAWPGFPSTPYYIGPLDEGQHRVQLRTTANAITGVALTPGEYTVTVGMVDASPENNTGSKPTYSGIRQLYELPSHRGVRITNTDKIGGVPMVERSDVIPAISLHTRNQAVTGIHAYDTSIGGPVHDGKTVNQEIDCITPLAPPTSVEYPQVRFYARRFGNTNVPLTLTGLNDANGASVSITVEDFDALPEIVDGWREVTLRFDEPYPTFSNATTTPNWEWTADNLHIGSRWEILIADNYGTIGNTIFGTSIASYGAPFGSSVEIIYGDDGTRVAGDATLMFSLDPPAVTGLAVTTAEQTLAPIGTDDCGVDLACVPTVLTYNQVTWESVIPLQVADAFGRTVVSGGWGDSTLGTYQVAPTANSFAFAVQDPDGIINVDALNSSRRVMFPSTFATDDVLMTYEFTVDELPVGANAELSPMLRIDPANVGLTYYFSEIEITPAGQVHTHIQLLNGGAASTVAGGYALPNVIMVPGEYLKVYAQIRGNVIKLAVRSDDEFPETWDVEGTSSTLTSGRFGLRAVAETGLSNTLPFTFRVRNLTMYGVWNNIDFNAFGYYELQRQDDDDDDSEWYTVLEATSPSVTGFADYEARVGVESRYRIRTVNVLDFAGSWSNEQASTITSPGVTVNGGSGNSVLIFTTNERQDGSSNLAYVQVWESDISEDFAFPEADSVQLRELYRRDYPAVFRPTERGGERFTRTLLVQAAAVPSGRVRDGFRSLRDMAWDDVSYICVRNELGDRWFASVQVPSGRVRRNRRLYLAQVQIVEVSDRPCVVELPEE